MWNDIWHKKAPQQDLGLTFRKEPLKQCLPRRFA
jgi:hypothetical protein